MAGADAQKSIRAAVPAPATTLRRRFRQATFSTAAPRRRLADRPTVVVAVPAPGLLPAGRALHGHAFRPAPRRSARRARAAPNTAGPVRSVRRRAAVPGPLGAGFAGGLATVSGGLQELD